MSECIHLLDPAVCADCRSIPGYDQAIEVTECRSCGDPIVWTITHNGKRMPVDADPSSDGNVRLDDDPVGDKTLSTVLSGRLLRDARERDVPLHTSHFATCLQAQEWRK